MQIKVKNEPALVRDSDSKAILNKDTEAYNMFMKKRKQDQEHDEMVKKVNKIECDLQSIKEMLQSLIK